MVWYFMFSKNSDTLINRIYYRETLAQNYDVQEITLLSDDWTVTRIEVESDIWPKLHVWIEARFVGDLEITPVKRKVQVVRGSTFPEDSVPIAAIDVPNRRIDNLVLFNKH